MTNDIANYRVHTAARILDTLRIDPDYHATATLELALAIHNAIERGNGGGPDEARAIERALSRCGLQDVSVSVGECDLGRVIDVRHARGHERLIY